MNPRLGAVIAVDVKLVEPPVPSCPTCHNTFPAGTDVCPRDGATLMTTGAATQAGLVMAATVPGVPTPARARPRSPSGAASSVTATAPNPEEEAKFDSLVGAVLADRYQIVRRIGEGGMGAVYEAKHTVIGKRVAVKVLLEKFVAKSDFVARLLQEARLASSIGHEHIVDVTDFGTTVDGRSFVVMEFLDGESLAELAMREAPLPIERSLGIARQVASALGAAHAKGIFHRDVKPENIYLVKRGDADFVKVVDFGISKAVKPAGDEGGEGYRLTHTGLVLGTPLYMSPEQARGEEDLDHRVDIWALGVLLYECLTGEVPFRANNYLGIISQVLTHEPTPPSKLRPELGISGAVEAVVMRAMEKDRDAPLPDDGRGGARSGAAAGGRPERRVRAARGGAATEGRHGAAALAAAGRRRRRAGGGAAIALDLGWPSKPPAAPPARAAPAVAPPRPRRRRRSCRRRGGRRGRRPPRRPLPPTRSCACVRESTAAKPAAPAEPAGRKVA